MQHYWDQTYIYVYIMVEGTALIGQQTQIYNGGMYQRTQCAIKTYVPKLGHQTGL